MHKAALELKRDNTQFWQHDLSLLFTFVEPVLFSGRAQHELWFAVFERMKNVDFCNLLVISKTLRCYLIPQKQTILNEVNQETIEQSEIIRCMMLNNSKSQKQETHFRIVFNIQRKEDATYLNILRHFPFYRNRMYSSKLSLEIKYFEDNLVRRLACWEQHIYLE